MKHLIMILFVFTVAAVPAAAQGLPPEPMTTFALDCIETTDTGLVVWFGYETNVEAHWSGSGFDFVTEVGSHPRVFSMGGEGYPPDLPALLSFARLEESIMPGMPFDIAETIFLSLNLTDVVSCDLPPTPTAEPTPEPVCLAMAHNSATGRPYCYTPTESGIIPLPPAEVIQ